MQKYDPLFAYLRRQRADALRLTFAEIERLLGRMLPNAAASPSWWADCPGGKLKPQGQAWRRAGFQAALLPGETVEFRRNRAGPTA